MSKKVTERVSLELEALNANIKRLQTFTSSKYAMSKLTEKHQSLLLQQCSIMEKYAEILEMRLADLGIN